MNGQHGKAKSGAREWSRKGRKNEGKALRVRAKAKLAEEAEKGMNDPGDACGDPLEGCFPEVREGGECFCPQPKKVSRFLGIGR